MVEKCELWVLTIVQFVSVKQATNNKNHQLIFCGCCYFWSHLLEWVRKSTFFFIFSWKKKKMKVFHQSKFFALLRFSGEYCVCISVCGFVCLCVCVCVGLLENFILYYIIGKYLWKRETNDKWNCSKVSHFIDWNERRGARSQTDDKDNVGKCHFFGFVGARIFIVCKPLYYWIIYYIHLSVSDSVRKKFD